MVYCEAVQSAILATAWLLVGVGLLNGIGQILPQPTSVAMATKL